MSKPLPTVSHPPSPSLEGAATNRDIAANHRFPSGLAVRQTATRSPHGEWNSRSVETHARRKAAANETQAFRRLFSTLLAVAVLTHPSPAKAHGCRTHKSCRRTHIHRLERMVERRIRAVAPLRCYGQPSAVPCWIITRESRGSWTAWNPQAVHGFHARGFYQLLGHGEPWPVLVSSRYEPLTRKLAHHRIAHALWAAQQAGQAKAW